MPETTIYFKDNFFSAGKTEIYNGKKELIGSLDLKSAFTSSVDVLDNNHRIITKGYFPFFSRKWVVTDGEDTELGSLKQRFTLFSKKYEYATLNRGVYSIMSEAFSREYEVVNDSEEQIAYFKRLSGFFESPVYQLVNNSDQLSNEEVITMVMGVNMINKRNRNNNAGGASN